MNDPRPRSRPAPIIAATLLLACWTIQVAAQPNWLAKGKGSHAAPSTTLGSGAIQYDPGPPADALIQGPALFVGNRFDSRSGSPLDTGTITAIAAYWGGQDATFPILAALNTANTQIFGFVYVAGLTPFTFNTLSVSWPVPPAFLAGVLASSSRPSSADSVGIRSASINGQGFHGITFSNAQGAPVNPIPGANAMVRVSGTVILPVELMEFDIDD
jgi:hypothetical protein